MEEIFLKALNYFSKNLNKVLTFSNYACVGILVRMGEVLSLGMAGTNDYHEW